MFYDTPVSLKTSPFLQDMEEFVQSSGDDGIVVFSLGSFINNITTEKANMVAAALAQIPQKVREEPWQVLSYFFFSSLFADAAKAFYKWWRCGLSDRQVCAIQTYLCCL